MKEQKKYIKRDDIKNASHLEVSVYYSKGGYATPRDYYLSVRPVTRANGMISFDLMAGCTKLVLTANRYSEKQFTKATELASVWENGLIDAVIKKQAA